MNNTALIEALDTFLKQTSVDWRRYHRIADRAAPKVFRAFNAATAKLQLSGDIDQITTFLETQDDTNAIEQFNWAQFKTDIENLPLTKPFLEGAEMAVDEIIRNPELAQLALEGIRKVSTAEALEIKTSFTLRQVDAERFLEANQAFLATSINVESKEAVRQVILNGFQTGKAPRVMAREIKTMVGLNARQAVAIDNFRTKLESMLAQGKSPFKTVALTQGKIDSMVSKQTKKALRQRAQLVARSETIRSANAGVQASWQSAIDQGFLPATVKAIWLAAGDERTCPFCDSLDGTVVGIQETFSSTVENLDGSSITLTEQHPPIHPNCRCAIALEVDDTGRKSGANLQVDFESARTIRAKNVVATAGRG